MRLAVTMAAILFAVAVPGASGGMSAGGADPGTEQERGRHWNPGPGCYVVPALLVALFAAGFIITGRRATRRLTCAGCGGRMKVFRAVPGTKVTCRICGTGKTVTAEELARSPGAADTSPGGDQPVRARLHDRHDVIKCQSCGWVSMFITEINCPACGKQIRRTCPGCGYAYAAHRQTCPHCEGS